MTPEGLFQLDWGCLSIPQKARCDLPPGSGQPGETRAEPGVSNSGQALQQKRVGLVWGSGTLPPLFFQEAPVNTLYIDIDDTLVT